MKQKSGKENNTKQIKARQGKTIAIVLILLACAALIVCGGFVFLGNSSKNKVTKAQIGGYIVTVPSVYLLAENNEGVWATNNSDSGGYAGAVLINDTDYCTITVYAGNDQDINDSIKTLQAIKIKSE